MSVSRAILVANRHWMTDVPQGVVLERTVIWLAAGTTRTTAVRWHAKAQYR